jgi:hypothetical protein
VIYVEAAITSPPRFDAGAEARLHTVIDLWAGMTTLDANKRTGGSCPLESTVWA